MSLYVSVKILSEMVIYIYTFSSEVEQGKAEQNHESIKYKDQISLAYTYKCPQLER